MKFWICPKDGCINHSSVDKCDGCGMDAMVAVLLPNVQWLQFVDYASLDKWLLLTQKYGMKVWRKRK
jgi:hypothetical protein